MFGKSKEPSIGWGSETQGREQLNQLWPREDTGRPEQAVFLMPVPDFHMEADLTVNLLTSYGIPCFKRYSNEGALGKLLIGMSAYSPALYVPSSMLEDARALLQQIKRECQSDDGCDE